VSKTPKINKSLDQLSESMFGAKRSDALNGQWCVICKGPASEFKDERSKKEFSISGMCQVCQDRIFDHHWEPNE